MMHRVPPEIQALREHDVIRDVDLAFASLLVDMVGDAIDTRVLLAASLASRAVADGHICLKLDELAGSTLPNDLFTAKVAEDGSTMSPVALPLAAEWREALVVETACVGHSTRPQLMVLTADNRLYLHRYWQYERIVIQRLCELARPLPQVVEIGELAHALSMFFGETGRQRLAAYGALCSRLMIISGGPGTGKTYTIARIVEMLAQFTAEPLRVKLAAPTGKAANRMVESIRGARVASETVPSEAVTLHRLLGAVSGSSYFRHNRDNPIPADLIVVDEASMIDLPMMAKLLDAVGTSTRLVLLGDMDQLASVEPGAVFGDICRSVSADSFSTAFLDAYVRDTGLSGRPYGLDTAEGSGLHDCLVRLSESRRFPDASTIGKLARAINSGDADGAWRICLHDVAEPGRSLYLHDADDGLRVDRRRPRKYLRERILNGYRRFLCAASPSDALEALNSFRILCASRRGPFGVGALNRIVEDVLSFRQTSDSAASLGLPRALNPSGTAYDHRPIMITQNDYDSGLFNGDIGVILTDRDPASPTSGQRLAWFAMDEDTGPRAISPQRLPAHETAFAMTIHKSQGSEFANLLVVLAADPTPLISRELLYTALTRIKPDSSRLDRTGRIDLVCSERSFRAAVRTATYRHSGIAAGLLSEDGG